MIRVQDLTALNELDLDDSLALLGVMVFLEAFHLCRHRVYLVENFLGKRSIMLIGLERVRVGQLGQHDSSLVVG